LVPSWRSISWVNSPHDDISSLMRFQPSEISSHASRRRGPSVFHGRTSGVRSVVMVAISGSLPAAASSSSAPKRAWLSTISAFQRSISLSIMALSP
jgi:hypothetical protein